ncbi:hypothetical protein DPMN_115864 [Dreissena polymorpha]|nr:hypothetical protein DPMN_115864 [Dreissena polymorpha]
MVGKTDTPYIANVFDVAKEQNIPTKRLNSAELQEHFPYIKFNSSDGGLFEYQNAGHISPRKLVHAQKMLAMKNGCTYIDDVVTKVHMSVAKNGDYVMNVETKGGDKAIVCKKVLLATGAFTELNALLPGIKVDQVLCPLTVSLVEVSKEQAEQQLKSMPSVIYRGDGHASWHRDFPRYEDNGVGYYMLPPIKYPDGRYYIKLGHFHGTVLRRLQGSGEVKEWFLNGDHQLAEQTAALIKSLFKDVPMSRWHGDSCVVVETPTNRTLHRHGTCPAGGGNWRERLCCKKQRRDRSYCGNDDVTRMGFTHTTRRFSIKNDNWKTNYHKVEDMNVSIYFERF